MRSAAPRQSLALWGIDEAGRGPVLDSKTLKEEKREELFENLKADESIGWAVDVIYPKELSAKMLKKNKINLNEISHDSAIGLINRVLHMGFLLTEWVMLRNTELNCLKDFPVSNLWLQRLIVSIQLSQEIEPCGNGCLMKRQITCTGTSVPDTLEILTPRPG